MFGKNSIFLFLVACLTTFPTFSFCVEKTDSLLLLAQTATGSQKIVALNDYAEALLETELEEATNIAMQALDLAEKLNDHEQTSRAQHIIADAWYYRNNFLNAIKYYQACAQTEKELNGPLSQGYQNRLNDVGYCYNELALFEKAISYYQQALGIAQQRNDLDEVAANLNNIGQSYFSKGDYSKAITYFDQALKIDLERGNDEYISIDFNNIGKVYYTWQKYDKAIEYYLEGLDRALAAGNESMQAIRLSNIGQAYEAKGETDKALDYVNRALQIDERLGNTEKIGVRHSHIGLIYLKMGDYKKSLESLAKANQIFNFTKNVSSKIITLNHLGTLMQKQDRHNEALEYFDTAAGLARKHQIRAEEMRALKNISDIQGQQGNFQQALKYYQLFAQIKDSIFNEEKHRQFAKFEARYENEKKEKENELLRQEANIQRKQKTIFILTGIASLLLALSFMVLFSMKRKSLIQNSKLHEKERELHALAIEKKEKENQHLQDVLFAEAQINRLQTEKLQQKNRELSTSTIHILNKNEVLGNIRKMAADWMKQDNFDKTKNLKKLIHEVDQNTDLDEQWEQFKLHFESVHKGFFERLLKNFPKLTPNELKLCAYLRMNLSTKEIAQMLNISTESVTTKRYRLRKKLDLENEENLVGYLGNF
ncbi:MAG: tetratricopeptide repeat protein [Bacteroidales bacterium]|nr:tetratricopeptide repeat protein [Bacteroidales bacterium]